MATEEVSHELKKYAHLAHKHWKALAVLGGLLALWWWPVAWVSGSTTAQSAPLIPGPNVTPPPRHPSKPERYRPVRVPVL